MDFVIHRGNDEIGGTCLELRHEGYRLLVDYGMPLPGAPEAPHPPRSDVDAVLISHGHSDHHGRLGQLDPRVPVHVSAFTRVILSAGRAFLGKGPLTNTLRPFESGKAFTVGPFEVTPFPVDHSFPDSFAFRISAGNRHVFYSGDLREGGNLARLTRRLSRAVVGPLDILFLEGTMLERGAGPFPDEASVETCFTRELDAAKTGAFLICSGQNVERLVRAWKAAVRSGRTFVVDLYTAWVLSEAAKALSKSIPSPGWRRLRVLVEDRPSSRPMHSPSLLPPGSVPTPAAAPKALPTAAYARILAAHPEYFKDFQGRLRVSNFTITRAELAAHPEKYFVKAHPRDIDALAQRMEKPSLIFYSMWAGYLQQASGAEALRLKNDPAFAWKEVHASGHAVVAVLRRLAERLAPKLLVPIHTQAPDLMKDFSSRVLLPKRGERYGVDGSLMKA